MSLQGDRSLFRQNQRVQHVYSTDGHAVQANLSTVVWVKISAQKAARGIYQFAVDFNLGNESVKDSGNVAGWKLVSAEHYQKTRFATRSVTDNHQFLANRRLHILIIGESVCRQLHSKFI